MRALLDALDRDPAVTRRRWLLGAGYRYMDIDYDEGETPERKLFKVAYDGPYVFVAYTW